MSAIWGNETQFFYTLTPDIIDQSLIRLGLRPSGRVLALNSLENRVYDVEVDSGDHHSSDSVVIKFYRPGRWTENAIRDEHRFLSELHELEIPVVAPMMVGNESLHTCPTTGLFYAVFPKVRGRLKDELNGDEIDQIGRLIGRIHNAGTMRSFLHRPLFNPQNYVEAHFDHLAKAPFLPATLVSYYISIAQQLAALIAPSWAHYSIQRIHGDLHRGNILWTSNGPWMVDFDDTVMGPREQDLWLLLPGRDSYSIEDQKRFLEAYHSMARTPVSLSRFAIESFRSIRMIHFNGWISKRWEDPSFKRTYSAFDSTQYWEMQLLDLKEQWGHLQESLVDG